MRPDLRDALVVVAVVAGGTALVIWLGSLGKWWMGAVSWFFVGLLFAGVIAVSALMWIADDMEDPGEARRFIRQAIGHGVAFATLLAAGARALSVPYGEAEDWPLWADRAARTIWSAPIAVGGLYLVLGAARQQPRWVGLTAALLFLGLVVLIAAWPWLDPGIPYAHRIALAIVLVLALAAVGKARARSEAPRLPNGK